MTEPEMLRDLRKERDYYAEEGDTEKVNRLSAIIDAWQADREELSGKIDAD